MSVVDILPTIAKLTGAEVSPGYVSDGIDESSILLGKNLVVVKDIYWYYNNNPVPGKKENVSPVLALRSGKWKFLMEADGSKKQLYDLIADHKESKNLVDNEKEMVKQLSAKLDGWYTKFVQK